MKGLNILLFVPILLFSFILTLGGCNVRESGGTELRYSYEPYLPSDVQLKYLYTGGTMPLFEQIIGYSATTDIVWEDGLYLAAERELISKTEDELVFRVYLGIEDDLREKLTNDDIKLLVYVNDNEGARYVQLEGVFESDDCFVDLEGKIGPVTKDALKKHVDITLTREDFPKFFAHTEGVGTEFYKETFTVKLIGNIPSKADLVSTELKYEYRYDEYGATLKMPCLSEDDEALAKSLGENMYSSGWYLYPYGAELAFPTEVSNQREGRNYQVVPFLKIYNTEKPDFTDVDIESMLGRLMIITPCDGDSVYSDKAVVNMYFGFSEQMLKRYKDEGYSARLVIGSTDIGDVVIREVDDIYTNPDYLFDFDRLNELYYYDTDTYYQAITHHDLIHCKAVTLPDELFTDDFYGRLYVTVQFYKGEEVDGFTSTHIFLYYVVNGDNVLIIPSMEYYLNRYREE